MRKKFLFLWFGQFLIVLNVWFACNFYLRLWSVDEFLAMLFSPGGIIWLATFLPVAYYVLQVHIKAIDRYRASGSEEDLKEAQKRAASLPKWYMRLAMILALVGPHFPFIGKDFISKEEYVLGYLLSISLLFVFWPPFDLALTGCWEKWTSDIPLSNKYRAFNIRTRIFKVSIFLFFGGGLGMLTVAFAALYHAHSLEQAYDNLLQFGLVFYIFICIFGFLASWLLSNLIARGVRFAVNVADDVAGGNFEPQIEINSRDEIGYLLDGSLRRMSLNLKDIFAEAKEKARQAKEESERAEQARQEAEAARQMAEKAKKEGMLLAANQLKDIIARLTSASEEMSSQIDESSRGAEMQDNKASELSSAMEEMNASMKEEAKNVAVVSELSLATKKSAQEGFEMLNQLLESITHLFESSKRLSSEMSELGHQAEGISNITNMISDIADQTNLLALNAAIEAARAGDAGRGFAVVADEVRKLAEKTMAATKEVSIFIDQIVHSVKTNIAHSEQEAAIISQINSLAQNSGQALQDILDKVEETAAQVQNISQTVNEQSSVSEEITAAASEVSKIARDSSEGLVQSAMAMSELAKLSQDMFIIIQQMEKEASLRQEEVDEGTEPVE